MNQIFLETTRIPKQIVKIETESGCYQLHLLKCITQLKFTIFYKRHYFKNQDQR